MKEKKNTYTHTHTHTHERTQIKRNGVDRRRETRSGEVQKAARNHLFRSLTPSVFFWLIFLE